MPDVTIRLYYELDDGTLEDAREDLSLSDFGGVLPAAGDLYLDPGVLSGLDRNDMHHRRMLEVRRRIFNPRDHGGAYIALIVSERPLAAAEIAMMP